MLGPDFVRKANMLFMQFGGIDGLRKIAVGRGFSDLLDQYASNLVSASKENPTRFTDDIVRLILTEEVFSHSAEKPMFLDRIKEPDRDGSRLAALDRLFELADLNRSDMLYLIGQSRAPCSKGQRAPEQAGMDVSVLRRPMVLIPPGMQKDASKTITVDGIERPTTNNKGQPIAQTEEGIRNFWKWFADSRVVDAEGRPLVVYHGTDELRRFQAVALQNQNLLWTTLAGLRTPTPNEQPFAQI